MTHSDVDPRVGYARPPFDADYGVVIFDLCVLDIGNLLVTVPVDTPRVDCERNDGERLDQDKLAGSLVVHFQAVECHAVSVSIARTLFGSWAEIKQINYEDQIMEHSPGLLTSTRLLFIYNVPYLKS